MAKRAFDLLFAGLGLALLSPLLLAVALAIKLDSRGPVFYRQTRVGRGGTPFRIHKFRTMVDRPGGAELTVGADARITRVGSWLRRTKVDELAQLVGKPTDATFADGTPLPDRGTAESGAAYTSDQVSPTQVSLNVNGVTTVADLADFIVFAAQSQMHLNADGLCYIKGQNAADPYFQPHPN